MVRHARKTFLFESQNSSQSITRYINMLLRLGSGRYCTCGCFIELASFVKGDIHVGQ